MGYKAILPVTNVLKFKKRLWFTEYAFRMNRWFNKVPTGPLRVDAEITRRCNLNCVFCSRRASKINLTEESKSIELPKERWVELARESGELGAKNWNISGIGEPMCRPEVTLATMEMIKAYDMFGELTTNGTLWKDEWIKKTVDMDWDSICVSIDAPDAETHDSLRQMDGSFKKATKTVERFAYWRKRVNSDIPSITLNVVMNKRNYNKLPDMVELGHKLGVDAIFVEPMIIFSEMATSLKLGKKEIRNLPDYVQKARDLGEKYNILPTISCVGVELEFDEKLLKMTSNVRDLLLEDAEQYSDDKFLSIPCYAPWFSLIIRADGSVLHCGEWDASVENARNKSLHDIWSGEAFAKIREDFLNGKLHQSCDKCRPNVINDTRQIRKSIKRGRDVSCLQKEILGFLEENEKLRKETYLLRKIAAGGEDTSELREREKELIKIKSSLTYRFFSKFGNTKLGKKLKLYLGNVHER